MTTDDAAGQLPGTYSFQVTCYRRGSSNPSTWSSVTSGEGTFADANRFMSEQAAAAESDGLRAFQTVDTATPAPAEGNDQGQAVLPGVDALSGAGEYGGVEQ